MIRCTRWGLSLTFALLTSPGFAQRSDPASQTGETNAEDARPKAILTLKGHTSPVVSLSFLTDSRYVVSSTINETRLWDTAAGETKWKLPIGGHAAVSPDGRRIAVRSATTLQ